jgi:hypothetical protein
MHTHFIQPLLAADFVHLAIVLVVLLLSVMKQLFDASNKSAKKNVKMTIQTQPPQKIQPTVGPKPPVLAGQQADGLRSQVEEFLRRAGQPQGGQPSQAPAQRPVSEIEVLVKPPAPAPNRQRTVRRLKRQSVAEHVAETVTASTQTLAVKAEQLGQRIVNEDQQFDRDLKAKFDHTLGTLSDSTSTQPSTSPTQPTDTPAAQIAALLSNSTGMRQAVVVNEILHRPSYRW